MAELAAAIEGAQRVAWQLGTTPSASLEARELYRQLETARIELERLRGVTAQLREEIEPWLADQLGRMDDPEGPLL